MSRYFASKREGKDESGSVSDVDGSGIRSTPWSLCGTDRGSGASAGSGHCRAVRETKEWVIYEFGDYQKIQ